MTVCLIIKKCDLVFVFIWPITTLFMSKVLMGTIIKMKDTTESFLEQSDTVSRIVARRYFVLRTIFYLASLCKFLLLYCFFACISFGFGKNCTSGHQTWSGRKEGKAGDLYIRSIAESLNPQKNVCILQRIWLK